MKEQEIKAAVDAAVKEAVEAAVKTAVDEAIESFKGQIKDLNSKLGKQAKQLEKVAEVASKSASSLSIAEPVKKLEIPTTEFEVNGKTYKFKVPQTVIKGTNYLAEEILASEELKAFVVERGLGRIVVEVF